MRCLHHERGVCLACRRFEAALSAAVKGLYDVTTPSAWKPGIIAALSQAANA